MQYERRKIVPILCCAIAIHERTHQYRPQILKLLRKTKLHVGTLRLDDVETVRIEKQGQTFGRIHAVPKTIHVLGAGPDHACMVREMSYGVRHTVRCIVRVTTLIHRLQLLGKRVLPVHSLNVILRQWYAMIDCSEYALPVAFVLRVPMKRFCC